MSRGVTVFQASLAADNSSMRHAFEQVGTRLRPGSHGVLNAEIKLPTQGHARQRFARDLLRKFGSGAMSDDVGSASG